MKRTFAVLAAVAFCTAGPAYALYSVSLTGDWPATGITLGFGAASDSTRLQLGSGPATVAVAEQNGNDGRARPASSPACT